MILRTILKLPPAEIKIDHNDPIILTGSCFSTNIGQKLTRFKFQTLVNPYGVIYHPQPLLENLKIALEGKLPIDNGYLEYSEQCLHYFYHSDIRARTQSDFRQLIKNVNHQVKTSVERSNYIILTLGTAFYYYHTDIQQVVANCHKQPSTNFERKLSTTTELISILEDLVQLLHRHNESLKIIFTVSPVRHVRDGLVANSKSKAHLLNAAHELEDRYDSISYFPAYELLMDDLRDYRFYKDDLIHPNQQAIEYIWESFKNSYFNEETIRLNDKIYGVLNALTHRPFNPQSSAHQEFLKKMVKEAQLLSTTYGVDMSREIEQLSSVIIPT